jgi:hypothetical protein
MIQPKYTEKLGLPNKGFKLDRSGRIKIPNELLKGFCVRLHKILGHPGILNVEKYSRMFVPCQ